MPRQAGHGKSWIARVAVRRGVAICALALGLPLLGGGLALTGTDAAAQSLLSHSPKFDVRPGGSMGRFNNLQPRVRPHIRRFPGYAIGVPIDDDPPDEVYYDDEPKGPKKPRRPRRASSPSSQGRAFLPALNERRLKPDEVIIEIRGNPTEQQLVALATRHRLRRLDSFFMSLSNSNFYRWQIIGGRSVRSVVQALGNENLIATVQGHFVFGLAQDGLAQDKVLASLPRQSDVNSTQYAVKKLRLLQAHGFARGNNVLVAVIDSGVDTKHPELAGVIADTYDPDKSSEGPHAHGTGIAGLIAAHAQLTGAAPAAKILAARAFAAEGKSAESTTFAILKSLEWSVKRGARVINMSFAGPNDPAIDRALAAAHKKGIVLVAAVGNAGPKSPPLFPAANRNVIAVTATDANDRLFPGSNRGKYIAVAAPGVDVIAPAPAGSYQVASGTSFSAAQVSGIAALLIERRPDLTPDKVRDILISTSKDLGPKGPDNQFGSGLANALAAIKAIGPAAVDTATSVPLPTPQPVRR